MCRNARPPTHTTTRACHAYTCARAHTHARARVTYLRTQVSPSGEIVEVLSPGCSVALLGAAPGQLVGVSLFRLFRELGALAEGEAAVDDVMEELKLTWVLWRPPAGPPAGSLAAPLWHEHYACIPIRACMRGQPVGLFAV
jgi:hypothetical protein